MDAAIRQIYEDVMQLVDRVKSCTNDLAESNGITKVQVFVLYSISRHGELPMGKAAEVMHCDASNVTGLVDRLVSQGLVIRKECEHDRRSKTLALTAKGEELVENFKSQMPTLLGCDSLTSEEQQAFHHIVQKMNTNAPTPRKS